MQWRPLTTNVSGPSEADGTAVVTDVVDVTSKVVNACSSSYEASDFGCPMSAAEGDSVVRCVVSDVGRVVVTCIGCATSCKETGWLDDDI